jgi:hypothetical protein
VRSRTFTETPLRRGVRQIVAGLLSLVLLVTVAGAGAHGHDGLVERPQACALCQANYQLGETAVPPALPEPSAPTASRRALETVDRPEIPSRPVFILSRAPPA